ncbi:hypothetical protein RchiOBHm_Chr2g0112011 [Rosa chinensis]|uniref:PAP/OAS1 substrate-binding-related domain-containing protein n=1 Tax=Rosa chinensis TaxID=74649 RepID=A0A2P6RQ64_ROSCH|nr:hypothetical protein RchiOBHm_Chr2g0112011 [Rosa chinensis]
MDQGLKWTEDWSFGTCWELHIKDSRWYGVKLVKCLVQNIVVDISFNQLGGLCTLCFLEQVDRLIGKHHLFKRSIILIKAWCYCERRVILRDHSMQTTLQNLNLISQVSGDRSFTWRISL